MSPDRDHDPLDTALPEDHVPSPSEAADSLLEDQVEEIEGELLIGDGAVVEPIPEFPDDPEAAKAILVEALMTTRQEAGEYLETMQRVAAEFENYRKRTERDRLDSIRRGSQRILEQLLPSLDNFDAALAYEPQTPSEEKILDGMRGTYQLLIETLEREGLTIVPAVGHPFDPAVHEAVAGGGDGHLVVAQELRRGYFLQERLIRPSLVVVEALEASGDPEPD